MKNIQNKLFVLILIILAFPNIAFLPSNITKDLSFEVNRIYPYVLVTKDKLKKANTLTDINMHYKRSWVREFISVEILTENKGKIIKSVSKSDKISQEQKNMMLKSDAGTSIAVIVKYIPENTLSHNDPKEYDFTFTLDPEKEAKYISGDQKLKEYLKEKAINKIPSNSFKGYDLTAIKFTINQEGEVINAHIFGAEYQSSKKEKIDNLLLETIRNMPRWNSAEYSNGTKVNQEFVLTVGNMENCMINLLNIQRNGKPRKG